MNNLKLVPSLLVFAEVASRKSFTAAAQHLGLSKSAVSQHISRLEEQIGAQLLSRNTRGMALTTLGEIMAERSERLKDQASLAFQTLAIEEDTPKGPFSFTIPHSLQNKVAVPALAQLCREFPGIEPKMVVTDETLDLIQEDLDVAIFAGAPKDSAYRALPLGNLIERFYAAPSFLQQRGEPKSPKELGNYGCIWTNWQRSPVAWYHRGDPELAHFCTEQPVGRSNSLSGVVEMAKQDMGIIFVPEIAVSNDLDAGKIKHILPDYHGKNWPTYFIHAFQGERPRHITRFYELLKRAFVREGLGG